MSRTNRPGPRFLSRGFRAILPGPTRNCGRSRHEFYVRQGTRRLRAERSPSPPCGRRPGSRHLRQCTAPNRIRASVPIRTAARTTAVAATQAPGSTRGVSPCRPPGRDYQEYWAAHLAARVHHRYQLKAECRCAMSRKRPRTPTRRPRCGATGPQQPGPARDLHRRRLPRRRRTIGKRTGWRLRLAAATAGRSCRQTLPVTI